MKKIILLVALLISASNAFCENHNQNKSQPTYEEQLRMYSSTDNKAIFDNISGTCPDIKNPKFCEPVTTSKESKKVYEEYEKAKILIEQSKD